ncbi:MAG TPA: prepilin peptidase [Polyangiaceae bacterium]|nr:prepilin peptidase [Polyangiaceae bacterium]
MTVSELGLSPWPVRAAAFLWGCIWGSFINVVIYRLPRGMSVVRPPSHCPACGAPVRPIDNVPILSWLLLRGRARCCGARISARYAVVEALGGALSVAIADLVVRSATPHQSASVALSIFLVEDALAMALLAAGFIDAEHMYVPDSITLGGTTIGLLTTWLRGMSLATTLEGATLGFLGVWLPFVVLYGMVRGRQGMGLGDAKLVMLAGSFFGWQGAAFALFAGAVQATVATLVLLATRGRIDEPESVVAQRAALLSAAQAGDDEARKELEQDPLANPPEEGILAARMPFGPFLCLATIEWMLFAGRIYEMFPWLEAR